MPKGSHLTAFEPTAEDVATAAAMLGVSLDLGLAQKFLDGLDPETLNGIAKAAVEGGDDLDEQSLVAQRKLGDILEQSGFLNDHEPPTPA